jgi:membrane fusion protein (multidrug efflux system)
METVLALHSITLRNELPGTVREVRLIPEQVVEAGTLLVALDVSVEEAALKAQEAQAILAKSVLNRRYNLNRDLATTQEEVDRAHADLNVALAQIASQHQPSPSHEEIKQERLLIAGARG